MEQNKEKKNIFREFGLTSLAVDNGTSIFILTMMIILFGFNSYRSMPKELFPEIVIPTIYVGTPYPGVSAVDIENLVTKPIEKEIKSVAGVKEIKSTNIQGYSTVIVEFGTDVEVPIALADVKDAVDKSKGDLPTDLPTDPNVFDINFSEFPVVTINLAGDYTVDELRGYGEYLQDKIEALDEVTRVDIKGALDREVKIDVDPIAMEARQLSFGDIEQAIQSENLNVSGGEVLMNGFRRAIRVVGEFETANEISNIVVKSENQNPVYLRDVAKVSLGFEDATSYARADQLPVVSLDVVKKAGANLLDAIDNMKVELEKAEIEKLPSDLNVTLFNDQSVQVRQQIGELENSIISGVILVVLVLLFFLGTRNAMFVGLAIPLSMLMGILILNILGVSLNFMVLFSLILALGLLVDNAIVVVENVYRYMQEGYSGWDAAKKGTGEVAVPIIASTATTLAAFIPLAFWEGIIGSFMKYLPITLIIVLSSSLFVALVINPVFTATLMKVDEKSNDPKVRRRKLRNKLIGLAGMALLGIIFAIAGNTTARNMMLFAAGLTALDFFVLRPVSLVFQERFLPFLESIYDKIIRLVLKGVMPYIVFGGTFGLLILSFVLLGKYPPKTVTFPETPPNYVNIFVEMPLGTDIEVTNNVVKKIEDKVANAVKPYNETVDAILTQVGEGTGDPGQPGGEQGGTPHKGRITVAFVTADKRQGTNTFEIMDAIREGVKGQPGVSLVIDKDASGPPVGKPINLELAGEDIEVLAQLSQDVLKYLNDANVAGVEELITDVNLSKPELVIDIDREAARRYGLSTYSIAMAIRTSVFGKEITKLKVGNDEYPIQIRLNKKYRNNVNALLNQKVTFRDPGNGQISQIPISAVAKVNYSTTYSSIKRKDLDRAITIYSNVIAGYNPAEILEELEYVLGDFDFPEGYTHKFTGEQEEQEEATNFLIGAFGIALFAIFLILVAQFNSLINPVIIFLSIVFSTIGVFLGLVVTQMDFVVVMTGIGIISLAGIVVNNAIVLIDYINFLRERKREEKGLVERSDELSNDDVREAIVLSGKTRLRPVLLTAITTVLGLIPLAIGFNMNFGTLISDFDPQIFIGGDNVAFWGPMSWTIINGLVFATFLTLIVVPVMYWLFFRFTRGVSNVAAGKALNSNIGNDDNSDSDDE
ncbi:MAG: efflux RND transporter permease subunit [Saprospiraceae bacterium]